ncbi:LacI family DNA-binding transcriptional regulator [Sphaerisporangium perillae]|uniref:LacI family DNA-binding transcriptional regulator n=1 Tax=Sphaerisporangium perillae TaxID=2935860 RepID=UPI0024359275
MDAVNELGYVPNSAARSLVTQRTDTVGLVVLDSPLGTGSSPGEDPDGPRFGAAGDDPLFSAVVRSAGHALEEAGKQVTLMLGGSRDSRRRVEKYVVAGHVDGIVIVPGRGADPLLSELARTGVPMVSLGRPAASLAVPYVGGDDTGGARAAVTHLLGQGRRRIAMICGPLESAAAHDRLAGYRDTLRDAGRRSVVAMGDLTRASGARAMRELLQDDSYLDAVFAAGDLMAIGALSVLHEAGRRVPDDVAVVGFDDIEAASYATPPLTTVRSPAEDQARAAVRLLLRQIDGGPISSVILPTELIVRSST